MQKIMIFICVNLLLIIAVSCEKEDRDTELPVITMDSEDHFPQNCDTIHAGKAFYFRALFSDNHELGSYTVDIHENFDHHSHSTEAAECPVDPVKTPVNPFLLIKQFDIPAGKKEYPANQMIEVPDDIDPGDYHFMVRLTDKTGWQTIRGISIKIMESP